MTILVTGSAGFIGSHVSSCLLKRGDVVVGIDNLNDYYDVELKHARLAKLQDKNFTFVQLDIADKDAIDAIFKKHAIHKVVHLAAQAGVRYSIENPWSYLTSNLTGFLSIIEACRHNKVAHLVYASSSSVYGANINLPFRVEDSVDHPLSLYAATKKSNELMAHCYSNLYQLPTTGLRFFTVYGPWGRPDMALFLFTKNILANKPIQVFNYGNHTRDFTFIDDIVEGIIRVLDNVPVGNPDYDFSKATPATSSAPYRLYNIGNNHPVKLMDYIKAIENALSMQAEIELLPLQQGDVPDTEADVSTLIADVGFKPYTSVQDGINQFIDWYRDYYQV
ncbi:dTDP-glucose 4,6-dehydratase [hydrothermal vent metagenome]|uniref:dTDP-glucose 4,6-dehydratase n=1 Tax=hydrothermal vent metagenome TaxID=652676 RepID=A0A3B0UY49_9ZZZZ